MRQEDFWSAQTHKLGQPFVAHWTPEKVVTAPDSVLAFAQYAHQKLGVHPGTLTDQKILRKQIKQLFEMYPRADFYTLCRIVEWCKSNGKYRRPSKVYFIVKWASEAWKAGVIPELDPVQRDVNVEVAVKRILETETDPLWRKRLVGALSFETRRQILADWQAVHAT